MTALGAHHAELKVGWRFSAAQSVEQLNKSG
jgi:hypothetical protein